MKLPILVAFAATIPAANWTLGHIGTECVPGGPCLIPVGFGLAAPSAALWAGVALSLRDAMHEAGGWRWVVAAIAIGCALSAGLAPPSLVVASAAAFLLSEAADFAVYAPLRRRGLGLAVFASGVVGAAVDTVAFLLIAFGSMEFAAGMLLAKLYTVAIAAAAAASFGTKRLAR